MKLREMHFNKLVSLKNIIVSRAYSSAVFKTMSDEFITEAPYNYGSLFFQDSDPSSSVEKLPLDKIECIVIWAFLGGCYCSYVVYQINNVQKLQKIKKMVDYDEIQKQIKVIIFVTLFLLFKNVPNAI